MSEAMNTNSEANRPVRAEEGRPPMSADSAAAPQAGARKSRPLPEDALAILPVRSMVLFPGAVVPITIGRPRSLAAAQHAARAQRPIGVLLQRKAEIEDPGPDDMHWVGTTANVLRYVTGLDGSHHVVAQGQQRFRVLQFLEGYDFPVARVERVEEKSDADPEIEARGMALKARALEIMKLLPQEIPQEMIAGLQA